MHPSGYCHPIFPPPPPPHPYAMMSFVEPPPPIKGPGRKRTKKSEAAQGSPIAKRARAEAAPPPPQPVAPPPRDPFQYAEMPTPMKMFGADYVPQGSRWDPSMQFHSMPAAPVHDLQPHQYAPPVHFDHPVPAGPPTMFDYRQFNSQGFHQPQPHHQYYAQPQFASHRMLNPTGTPLSKDPFAGLYRSTGNSAPTGYFGDMSNNGYSASSSSYDNGQGAFDTTDNGHIQDSILYPEVYEDECFASPIARVDLSYNKSTVKISIGEVKRRLAPPECYTTEELMDYAKIQKTGMARKNVQGILAKHHLVPREHNGITMERTVFHELFEAEAENLASDFGRLVHNALEEDIIAAAVLIKTERSGGRAALDRLQRHANDILAVLKMAESVIRDAGTKGVDLAKRRAPKNIQEKSSLIFMLKTHRFGPIATVAVLEFFGNVLRNIGRGVSAEKIKFVSSPHSLVGKFPDQEEEIIEEEQVGIDDSYYIPLRTPSPSNTLHHFDSSSDFNDSGISLSPYMNTSASSSSSASSSVLGSTGSRGKKRRSWKRTDPSEKPTPEASAKYGSSLATEKPDPKRETPLHMLNTPIIKHADDDELFDEVYRRFGIFHANGGKNCRVTIGEMRRRVFGPEKLHASILAAYLRKAKKKDAYGKIREQLDRSGIYITTGGKKLGTTAWSALVEDEARDFADGALELLEKVTLVEVAAELRHQQFFKDAPTSLFLTEIIDIFEAIGIDPAEPNVQTRGDEHIHRFAMSSHHFGHVFISGVARWLIGQLGTPTMNRR